MNFIGLLNFENREHCYNSRICKIQKKIIKNISPEELIILSDEFNNYDITDHLDESEPVDFEIKLTRRNFRLEKSLAEKIARISQQRGISIETYINLVLQEKILEESELQDF